jgi:ubiquinone biosynthesis monooxygenase Coq7
MPNFKKKLQEIIRVDHAGEMGAKVIYAGQIAALKLKKDHETLKIVEHMKEQEDVHFDYFDEKMRQKKVRPTVMQPVWKVGGFALGFVTAMLDKKAAMACTTAVEETIDLHYQEQIAEISEEMEKGENPELVELKSKIEKFREEELEHRDIGYENNAEDLVCFKGFSRFVKGLTGFAIKVSKRI